MKCYIADLQIFNENQNDDKTHLSLKIKYSAYFFEQIWMSAPRRLARLTLSVSTRREVMSVLVITATPRTVKEIVKVNFDALDTACSIVDNFLN